MRSVRVFSVVWVGLRGMLFFVWMDVDGLFGSGVRVWWRCGDFGRNGISLRVRGLRGLTGVGWVVSAALDA
jgi:hypothetical protein